MLFSVVWNWLGVCLVQKIKIFWYWAIIVCSIVLLALAGVFCFLNSMEVYSRIEDIKNTNGAVMSDDDENVLKSAQNWQLFYAIFFWLAAVISSVVIFGIYQQFPGGMDQIESGFTPMEELYRIHLFTFGIVFMFLVVFTMWIGTFVYLSSRGTVENSKAEMIAFAPGNFLKT